MGVPAVVRRGDALLLEYSENWFTPAYIFAYPHFAKKISKGGYPQSPVVVKSTSHPKNAEKNEPPKKGLGKRKKRPKIRVKLVWHFVPILAKLVWHFVPISMSGKLQKRLYNTLKGRFFCQTSRPKNIYYVYNLKTPPPGRILKTFSDAVWRTRHRPETESEPRANKKNIILGSKCGRERYTAQNSANFKRFTRKIYKLTYKIKKWQKWQKKGKKRQKQFFL